MYHLLQGPCLEELLVGHQELFSPQNLISKKILVITPNEALMNWISLRIAHVHGILCGLDIVPTRKALEKILEEHKEQSTRPWNKNALYQDDIHYHLFCHLEGKDKDPQVQEEQVQRYRRSRALAEMFYHYGLESPELLQTWRNGTSAFFSSRNSNINYEEKNQRTLYDELFLQQNLSMPSFFPLGHLLALIQEENALINLSYQHIVMIADAFLSPQIQEFLFYLSEYIDIYHLSLLTAEPSSHLPLKALHPWNRYAYKKQKNLIQRSQVDATELFSVQSSYGTLNLLQNALSESTLKEVTDYRHTVSITTCETLDDEIQYCIDNVLRILQKMPQARIWIATPHREIWTDYQNLLEEFFLKYHLPFCSSIPSPQDGFDPYIQGIDKLFLLLDRKSRFSRQEIMTLWRNQAFARRHDLSRHAQDQWFNLLDETQTLFGHHAQHRQSLKLGYTDQNTWHKARERFLWGQFFTQSDNEFFDESFLESHHYDENMICESFVLLDQLYREKKRFEKNYPLETWLELLKNLFENFLQSSSQDQEDLIEKTLSAMHKIHSRNKKNNTEILWSFQTIKEFFKNTLENFLDRKKIWPLENIILGTLDTWSFLSFDYVFILGLDERAQLKETSPRNFYDLLLPWQEKNQQDQFPLAFIFLRTILLCRQGLYLSWNQQSPRGQNYLPSVLLLEIKDLLKKTLGNFFPSLSEEEHESHFLHSFGRKNFLRQAYEFPTPYAPCFEETNWKNILAKTYAENSQQNDSVQLIPFRLDQLFTWNIVDILKIAENPFQFFYKKRLQFILKDKPLRALWNEQREFESFRLSSLRSSEIFAQLLLEQTYLDSRGIQEIEIRLQKALRRLISQDLLHESFYNMNYSQQFVEQLSFPLQSLTKGKSLERELYFLEEGSLGNLPPFVIDGREDMPNYIFKGNLGPLWRDHRENTLYGIIPQRLSLGADYLHSYLISFFYYHHPQLLSKRPQRFLWTNLKKEQWSFTEEHFPQEGPLALYSWLNDVQKEPRPFYLSFIKDLCSSLREKSPSPVELSRVWEKHTAHQKKTLQQASFEKRDDWHSFQRCLYWQNFGYTKLPACFSKDWPLVESFLRLIYCPAFSSQQEVSHV